MTLGLREQGNDIKGNVKYAIVCGIGAAVVTGVVALTHGLLLWQQVVLTGCFVLLFGWMTFATTAAWRHGGQSNITAQHPSSLAPSQPPITPLALGDGGLDLGFKGMSSRHKYERDGYAFHRITVSNGSACAADNVEVILLDVDTGDKNDLRGLPGHYPHAVISPFTLNPGADSDVEFARSWTDSMGRLMVAWNGSSVQPIELKEGLCWHISIGARSASHQLRPLAIFMKYEKGHVWTDSILLSLPHCNLQ